MSNRNIIILVSVIIAIGIIYWLVTRNTTMATTTNGTGTGTSIPPRTTTAGRFSTPRRGIRPTTFNPSARAYFCKGAFGEDKGTYAIGLGGTSPCANCGLLDDCLEIA